MTLTQEQIRNAQPFLAMIDEHMAAIPQRNDCVHDMLAFLAEEMLRINKQKQTLEQSFLAMIASTLHIQPQPDEDGKSGIDAMKSKTALLNYIGDYHMDEPPLSWRHLQDILIQNRKICDVQDFDRLLFDIEQAYHQNLDTVLPIKIQIECTDYLIDQTVYRLYGLTKEEIAVVESTVNAPIEAAKERKRQHEAAKHVKRPKPEKRIETYGYPSF